MDYKILLILIIILLLIIYIIKELYFIKLDLSNFINNIKSNQDDMNLLIRKNFQNDLNVFTNKIKLLNDENLQQFRKISILNSQPIVKNNNYFKEIDMSDSDESDLIGTELRYLSDSKYEKEIIDSSTTSLIEEVNNQSSTTEDIIDEKPEDKENKDVDSIVESEYLKILNSVNQENTDISENDIKIEPKINNKLNNIDTYTAEQLKNMAKKNNIALSIKVGNKWKSLNKTELYNELFNYFNK